MPETSLLRHIEACDNADLPGDRVPFRVGDAQIGWVLPDTLRDLEGVAENAAGVSVADEKALTQLSRAMADCGLTHWRDEPFDVGPPDRPALVKLDRGAVPMLGCQARGVHLNGLVRRADGNWLWVGRRAAHKSLDPGKMDHLAAGGVPAGLSLMEALYKEAAEEAGLDADMMQGVQPVGVVSYTMNRKEGLRRDHLHVFDLYLPESFKPFAADGEMDGFELWPMQEVLQAVRTTDQFKFNVNLVLIDLFLRSGLVDALQEEGQALRARLDRATQLRPDPL